MKKIKITISRPRGESFDAKKIVPFKERGIIRRDVRADYLPRRKKAAGGIRFFDLGQIKFADVFVSNSAQLVPNVTVFSDIQIAAFNVTDEDKENFVADIYDDVTNAFGEDYADKFYKIGKSDASFSKSISAVITRGEETVFEKLSDLPEWKESGLVLNQSQVENLTIQPHGTLYAINNINFANLSGDINRVTLTNDINAENVAFTPSPKMDILLMPGALFSYSFTLYKEGIHSFTDVNGTHTDFILKGDYLNFFWHVFARGFWSETIEVEESDLSDYQKAYRQWQIQKQFLNSRVKRLTYDFIEMPPYIYHTTVTDENVSDFPYPAIYQDSPAPVSGGAGINNDQFQAAEFNDLYELQKLKFIIRKNDQFYFFWKTP